MGNINPLSQKEENMKYTDSHEWVFVEGARARVGICTHAQKELGEVVHVELPEIGEGVVAGSEIATLESTKAATDIYSPISGRVTKINERLKENPSSLNEYPESEGWLFELDLTNPSELEELLDKTAYQKLLV